MTHPAHPLAYLPAPPRRVAVHTPAAVAWHPCTALLACERCGLVVAHYDVGRVAPRAAHGLDVDALVAARRLPPCEVRA